MTQARMGESLLLVIHECYRESRGRGRKEELRKYVTDGVLVQAESFSVSLSGETELR